MRIGHYMPHMFEPGGIASYIRRVSDAQRAAGHALHFFDRTDPAAVATHAHPAGHPVAYTADDFDLFRRADDLAIDVLHVHAALSPDALALPPAARIIRTVHTHAPYCPSQGRFLSTSHKPCDRSYSLMGCLWGHFANHCGSVRPAILGRNFRTVQREMATLPQIQTLVVSQFIKDQMIRAGYPSERIHVLHLPAPDAIEYVDPGSAGPARFLFLGRMIPHKGVDWLLRSLRLVQADVQIDLAGSGNQEQQYRHLAHELGLTHRTRFLGWLNPEEVCQAFASARALVFPSLWHEPGGLVAFEAMTHGRPVIMSRVGGMPEVVEDNLTGLLVPPGDETALARAIDTLATDPALARRLGQTARQRARDIYSLDSHLARLMSLYAQPMNADVQKRGGSGIPPVKQLLEAACR